MAILKEIILGYLSARFGVTSLSFVINPLRVLLNVFAVLLVSGAMLGVIRSYETEMSVIEIVVYVFLFLLAAVLVYFSERLSGKKKPNSLSKTSK